MKTVTTLCAATTVTAAAVLIAARPVPAAPQDTQTRIRAATEAVSMTEFGVDAVHSMALFRVQHLGAGAFWGRFNGVSGTIQHNPGATDGLRLDVSIDIDSVDTGSESLDGHLKSPDFFNVSEFSTATFTSTSSRRVGKAAYEVTGEFTLHGVTKTITAAVEWVGSKEGQRGHRCGFEAVFTVKRSEYGMTYGVERGALGDDTRIIVALEGLKREASEGEGRERREGRERGRGGSDFFSRFDANGDGKIEKEELPERMRARFDDMDTDGDGSLSAEEVEAMIKRRRGGQPR